MSISASAPSAPSQSSPSLAAEDQARLEAATHLHGTGDLAGAEPLYRALLSAPGAKVGTLRFVLGLLREEMGDPAGALAEYDLAAAAGCAAAPLAPRRAELLRRAGRWVEALAAYDLAISQSPAQAELHHARGVTLAALGRTAEALGAYDAAIVLDRGNPKAHGNRGVALEALGQTGLAIEAYVAALRLDPLYRHAHHNLGSALLAMKEDSAAAESLERALNLDDRAPETWNLLGMARCGQDRHADALTCFDRALALRPAYAEAHNNRSIALRWERRFDEALASADRALALEPVMAEALNSRAVVLLRLSRPEEALLDLNAALALRPRSASAHLNRGSALEAMGDVEAAMADFEQAIRLEPDIPDGDFNLGLAYLRLGDYRQGFPRYERRWGRRTGPFLPYPEARLWRGQPVAGRTILVTAEQGFGDVIQFSRFATDVAALGARTILQVQPQLKRLMQGLAGPYMVIGADESAPAFDLFCPVMSLPTALNLELSGVRRSRYLSAAPDDVDVWRKTLDETLGEGGRLRVGLTWAGNPGHENDHNRSMSLAALAPLFDRGFDLVSLQKEHALGETGPMEAAGISAFDARLHDFSDTAALIAACDAVVTVDTAVAHLAAAMGKPAFILLPKVSDWRWMNRRLDTPWYPSARLCRQSQAGDWSGPVATALDGLEGLALQAR